MAKHGHKPSREELGRIVERQPMLLNALVAFFCFGWESVLATTAPMHGKDQTGTTRILPNYIALLGVDECFHMILEAPNRGVTATDWLDAVVREFTG